jgi:hypothetical protein
MMILQGGHAHAPETPILPLFPKQPQLFLLKAILRLGGWADGMLGDGAGTMIRNIIIIFSSIIIMINVPST